jgi:uracil-DNA glycosylase
VSELKSGVVFLLWGRYAQAKQSLIDDSKHLVLKAAHPSPLSAYNGFFGCRHFSRTNAYLKQQGKKEIDWRL